VAIQAGSAVVVSEWVDDVAAVVQAWYGGCRAGAGLADVLTGTLNPSARLPFSVPVDEADLPPFDRHAATFRYDRWHGWWHLRRTGRPPAFPFGFGLSYTTFEVEGVNVSRDGDAIAVSATVRNTGPRDGADVVQVYATLPDPEAPERLVGFTRVDAPAGGTRSFSLRIPVDRLAPRDPVAHAWRAPAGRYRIAVGRHAGDPGAAVCDVEL
jgi:beta-glucosidase